MRAQIEAVLKEHNLAIYQKLVDDLLTACQPNREELEKILKHHTAYCPLICDITDQLIAWASRTERTWCEHWEWLQPDPETTSRIARWILKAPLPFHCIEADDLRLQECPICGTKRP